MKHKGPLLTLVVGVVLALALGGLSVRATSNATARDTAVQNAAQQDAAAKAAKPAAKPKASASAAAPAPSASAPATPPAKGAAPAKNVTRAYAGKVDGGKATVAIAISDGKAVAYVCDGKAIESWLKGSASAGRLNLTGANGGKLTATFTATAVKGSVEAGGKKWTFTAAVAKKPSGLYRSSASVRGAKVVAGWIVLADGTQVGLATVDGKTQPVPKLDPAAGRASVAGSTIPVAPADPASGS